MIAIANQKGGVGKSTTAVSLGAALADLGYRVLVVDLDPQGNASTGLGIRHDARGTTVYDVVVGDARVEDAIIPTQVARLDAVASTIDLAGAEIELVSQFSREARLKKAIEPLREGRYDFVFLDCPPSLGLLTVNALTAAEELIVPIQCEYYALEGLGQLLRNVQLVQQNINSGLRLTGIVMTMFDQRTKLSEQVVDEVRRFFGDLVYDVIIPRTVRLSEAPGYGQPITVYDPRSKGAETYRSLAREVASKEPPEGPLPTLDQLPTVVITRPEAPSAGPALEEEEGVVEPEPELEPVVTGGERELEPRDAHAEERGEVEGAAPATPGPDESASGPSGQADAVPEATASGRGGDADARPRRPAPEAPVSTTEAAGRRPAPGGRTASLKTVERELWDDAEAGEEPRVRAPSAPIRPGGLPERRVVVIDEESDIDIEAGREPLVQTGRSQAPPDAVTPIGATLESEKQGRKRRWRLFRKGGNE